MSKRDKHILSNSIISNPDKRTELADGIAERYKPLSRAELNKLWIQESEERIVAYECGFLESISSKAVFNKINKMHIK